MIAKFRKITNFYEKSENETSGLMEVLVLFGFPRNPTPRAVGKKIFQKKVKMGYILPDHSSRFSTSHKS